MAPFGTLHKGFYWRSIVTVTLSGIVSEIKRDICRKSRFFSYPTGIRCLLEGDPRPIIGLLP